MVRKKNSTKRNSSLNKSKSIMFRKVQQFGVVKKLHFSTWKSIKYLQKSTHMLIPKLSFSRLVKEIIFSIIGRNRDLRIQSEALSALQEASEIFLVGLFEESNLAANHARRVTIKPIDIRFICRLKHPDIHYTLL